MCGGVARISLRSATSIYSVRHANAYAPMHHANTERPEHNGLLHAALDIPRGPPSLLPHSTPFSEDRLFLSRDHTVERPRGSHPAVHTRGERTCACLKEERAPRSSECPRSAEIYARAQVSSARKSRARADFFPDRAAAVNLTLKMLLNSIFINLIPTGCSSKYVLVRDERNVPRGFLVL